MRVLYIATSFPKPENGSTIYTDLAEAIHEAGHEITVAVSEETKNNRYTTISKERGFDVLRIVTGNYYDVGLIEKGLTTLKIPILMKKSIKKYLGNRKFDFILFESPPVTNGSLVSWAKKYFKCKSYLMLKDIFPQNAVDIGILKKNGLLYRYFKLKEKKLLKTADYIGCMSQANKNYILNKNPWIESSKVEIFPNTKKITSLKCPTDFPMRKRYKIPQHSCVFLFGGNMGRPQYIDFLCKVIKECKNEKDMFFMFVGRGTDRYKLEETIDKYKISNAIVIENLPRDEYEQIILECDVGLIILDPRFSIPNYPSRILSYMEYAKPVIAATDRVTDIKDLIQEADCGEWVWSGNLEGFIEIVKKMTRRTDLEMLGLNGRKYLEKNFSLNRSVKILESHFKVRESDVHK